MSKKKTKKRHKPAVKPCANHRPAYSTIAEGLMNLTAHRMQEALENTGPAVRLARAEAAHLYKEACKRRVFASDQADEE